MPYVVENNTRFRTSKLSVPTICERSWHWWHRWWPCFVRAWHFWRNDLWNFHRGYHYSAAPEDLRKKSTSQILILFRNRERLLTLQARVYSLQDLVKMHFRQFSTFHFSTPEIRCFVRILHFPYALHDFDELHPNRKQQQVPSKFFCSRYAFS